MTSSEPDDALGLGDGNTVNDIQGAEPGSADFDFLVRAERNGNAGGRTYAITYAATDVSGNQSSLTSLLEVARDRRDAREERRARPSSLPLRRALAPAALPRAAPCASSSGSGIDRRPG